MPFDGTNNEMLDAVRKMKERLATPDKWCQHQLTDGHGAFCLRGALHHTTNRALISTLDEAMHDEAMTRGWQPRYALLGMNDDAHVAFNNDPKTTHADILDFLDAVERRLVAAV